MRSCEVAKARPMSHIPPDAHLALDATAIAKALRRVAHEIVERNAPHTGAGKLAIVGIQTRGVEVARRLVENLAGTEGGPPDFGTLDISMYRDDLRQRPRMTSIQPTDLPFALEERTVVIVDDVFFTGRTIRAAMDALSDYGRPARIQLAALVDRGHRELPIRPDFVGKNLPTSPEQRVFVRFESIDGVEDSVWLEKI